MCSVNWNLLLEYLKVFLSWPPVALLVAFLFIARFKSAIDDFLKRLVEGNIFGQAFKAVPPSQKADTAGVAENRLAAAADAAPLAENQNLPAQLPPELVGDPAAPAAVAYIRANPAQTLVEYKRVLFSYNAERLFTRIFGTQIALLEYLSFKSGVAVPLAELGKFHEEHLQRSGRNDYQIRDYINFLTNFGVIAASGAENAFEYRITQHGVEFLSYIKANYPADWNQRGL